MQIPRKTLLAVAMAAATGGPYVADVAQKKLAEEGKRPDRTSHADERETRTAELEDRHAAPATPSRRVVTSSDLPVEGYPISDLGEILRFDIEPKWIMQRWGRVFSVPAEPGLRGYRVAVVTGSGPYDVAGSLTYYYDKEQRLSLITLQGTTGDPQMLARLVEQRFQLRRQQADDPGLQIYQLQESGRAVSELRVEPHPVVNANEMLSRYTLRLFLRRPSDFRMLSRDAGHYSDRLWSQR